MNTILYISLLVHFYLVIVVRYHITILSHYKTNKYDLIVIIEYFLSLEVLYLINYLRIIALENLG